MKNVPLAAPLVFATLATNMVVAIPSHAQSTTTSSPQAQASDYEILAKGVAGSRPFQVPFKSAPLRLEFRNLVMGHGESERLQLPTRVLMELREGGVTTTINQEKHERRQGDFWVVEKGNSLTIGNPGQVAVIRAIYIFEGAR